MVTWKQKSKLPRLVLASLLLMLCVPAAVLAAQSNSTNYQVNEVFFGSGGNLNSCSTGSYCSKQSAGELAVGDTKSATYDAHAGFNTDRTPYIQAIVSNTNIYLGTLDSGSTKTATATISVKAYLSHGYSIVTASDPPKNATHFLNPLAVPTASQAGTEQFGINLVANTSPTTFGANPSYSPDNTFAFGLVSTNYSSPNLYMYNKGDEVAYSTSSSSATTYTISYIFNVSNVTPGGFYELHHVLVATATY